MVVLCSVSGFWYKAFLLCTNRDIAASWILIDIVGVIRHHNFGLNFFFFFIKKKKKDKILKNNKTEVLKGEIICMSTKPQL